MHIYCGDAQKSTYKLKHCVYFDKNNRLLRKKLTVVLGAESREKDASASRVGYHASEKTGVKTLGALASLLVVPSGPF